MPMIIAIFLICSLILAAFVFPALTGNRLKQLALIEGNINTRLEQIKQEFKLRSKELSKRLDVGDLDEEEWQQLNQELNLDTQVSIELSERASDRKKISASPLIASFLMLVTLTSASAIYYFTGNFDNLAKQLEIQRQLVGNSQYIAQLTTEAETHKTQRNIQTLYQALREQIELDVKSIDSWRELSQFNLRYGRISNAYRAIEQALALEPENVDLQVELSQVLASSEHPQDLQLAHETITQILSQHPEHQGARLLMGFNAFALQRFQLAIDSWQQVIDERDASHPSISMLKNSISMAEQKLIGAEQFGVQNSSINVKVQFDNELASKLDGSEVVFVYVKAHNGPSIPLAAIKTTVAELQREILLSDKNAMQPATRLSNFQQVKVYARLSKNGGANYQDQDIQVESKIIKAPFENAQVALILK